MMKRKIKNLEELKLEIARLTELKREQEAYLDHQYIFLKDKVEKPIRILSSVTSSIPGVGLVKDLFFRSSVSPNVKNNTATGGGSDWLTNVARIGVPLLLNKTLLRKSSWVKKSLVLLASETAVGQVTHEKVTNAIAKIASFIRPEKRKKKHNKIKPLEDDLLIESVKSARIDPDDSPEDQILGV